MTTQHLYRADLIVLQNSLRQPKHNTSNNYNIDLYNTRGLY